MRGPGDRAPERRTGSSGYRERGWDTRVGELELQIPKLRSSPAYFPSFLDPRRRAEQALVAVVQEAYVNGVSTRKVDRGRSGGTAQQGWRSFPAAYSQSPTAVAHE